MTATASNELQRARARERAERRGRAARFLAGWILIAAAGTARAQDVESQALRTRLSARVERQRSSGLGRPLATALNELDAGWRELAPAEKARLRRTEGGLPTRYGSIKPRAPHLFHYLNPELEPSAALVEELPTLPLDRIVETIADFDRQLERHDVELWAAPIPTRVMIYPDLLVADAGTRALDGFAPGFTRFQLALLRAGVDVVDLMAPLLAARTEDPLAPPAEQVFLLDNSHWAPRGAAAAARAVAEHVRASPWYASMTFEAAPTRLETFETETLTCRTDGREHATGRYVVQSVVNGEGPIAAADDPDSPLVLLGDSFTTIFSPEGADFARHLRHRTGFAPDVLASPGGGSIASRRSFLRREDPTRGKRVVLWLFTIRAVLDKASRWRALELPR